LTQTSGIARLMSGLGQSRATAAFFSPKLHKVRASSRAAQPGPGIEVPKLNPVPTNAPPCPEIACELDVDLATPTPVPVVVDD
jgi:hypothetical protein